jgi:alpha-amylase/alpha-mannosidase (GH57 family)
MSFSSMRRAWYVPFIVLLWTKTSAQPLPDSAGVRFVVVDSTARSASVVGDFNGWSKDDMPMTSNGKGVWSAVRRLSPGVYQYKFIFDGTRYVLDPLNSASVPNYDNSATNSVFVLTEDGRVIQTAEPPHRLPNMNDVYPLTPDRKPVYLNIIWHQHQPLYSDPRTDQLTGPWVRTHATKDYYDMAAILREYPDVHCTINLTSSLLLQLREYYLRRMGPFVNTKTNRFNVAGFLKKWQGKTDPWIDLALKNTASFNKKDKDYLYRNTWNAFGINPVQLGRFPEYKKLRERLAATSRPSDDLYSTQELREIKFWFYLAHFDPDFLRGTVRMQDGSVCDLSEYVEFRPDSTFHLKRKIKETDCVRIVAEAYKVMANIIPVHSALQYDAGTGKGQVEVITTPYYHPILPLIYDSDLARICQPDDPMPPRFSYPADAHAQVAKAVAMYRDVFGKSPAGMWPGEGSVAQPVLAILRQNGILWSASDMRVLARSDPPGKPNTSPFAFPAGDGDRISMVFRDTELSDLIGFTYQNYNGEEAAEDFIRRILDRAPRTNEPDALVTVVLDGENAWEWYRYDIDGKEFLHSLYRKLSRLFAERRILTTTTAEYISGNPSRSIAPHPVETQPAMNSLWPGSWINGNFDTWIGEPEENKAWEYLLTVRKDLVQSGLHQPDPSAPAPRRGTKGWYAFNAWEEMYAAEGSDWFWWYGTDQTAPAGDQPFDTGFRIHLENIYSFAKKAGARIKSPGFTPIISGKPSSSSGGQGVMAQSHVKAVPVVFVCDTKGMPVPKALYIAGSLPQLGNWTPNTVRMHDDGSGGDLRAGDGIWTFTTELPAGTEVEYKYTNSGFPGTWSPGEEFAGRNRKVRVPSASATPLIIHDIFGQ